MSICIATIDDIPQLVELLVELFSLEHEFNIDKNKHQQGLAEIIANPQLGEIFISKQGEQIVAMLTVLYSISTALGAKVATFEDMIVAEQYRGGGLGGELLSYVINHAKTKGCKRLSLLTDSDNLQAHHFYRKHGFENSAMQLFRQLIN